MLKASLWPCAGTRVVSDKSDYNDSQLTSQRGGILNTGDPITITQGDSQETAEASGVSSTTQPTPTARMPLRGSGTGRVGGRSLQVRLLKEQEEEIRALKQNSVYAAGSPLSHAEIARLEKSQVRRRLDLSKEHQFRSRNRDMLQMNGQLLTVQGNAVRPTEKPTGIDVKMPHFPGCACQECNGLVERVCEDNLDKAAHERKMEREFARLMQLKRERTAIMSTKLGKDTGKKKVKGDG